MEFIRRKHQTLMLKTEFVLPWWRPQEQTAFRLVIFFGLSGLLEGVLEIFADMSWGSPPAYVWCEYRRIAVWPEGEFCKVGLFGLHPDWGGPGEVDMVFRCHGLLGPAYRIDDNDLKGLVKKYSLPTMRSSNRKRLAVAAEMIKEELRTLAATRQQD